MHGGFHASIVVGPGRADEEEIVVDDQLIIGREPSGVPVNQRLVVDDPTVSRHHLQIRLDRDRSVAVAVDTSTNGTRINGMRMERAVPVTLTSGDRLRVGDVELEYRTASINPAAGADPRATIGVSAATLVAMVVGDIIGYSTISQKSTGQAVATGLDELYRPLRAELAAHRGSFVTYAGDAFFALWELDRDDDADAVERAAAFALAAHDLVQRVAPAMSLRAPEGGPIEMGWSLTVGQATVVALPGSPVTALGDSTNLAYRLAGMAGRDALPFVVVNDVAMASLEGRFHFDEPVEVTVKGRTGSEPVYGLHDRRRRPRRFTR